MDRKEKRRNISEWFIFHWLGERNTTRTIIAFLIFSAVIHFIGLYLFIFEYPTKDKKTSSNQITILDPSKVEVRAYLERIRDRTVYLEPASNSSTSQVKLSDYAIRFAPSFAEVKPDVKRASPVDEVVQFEIPDYPARMVGRDFVNPVRFSPNLTKRGVAPHSILDDYLSLFPELPKLRIPLEVDSAGVPVAVLVTEGSEADRKLLEEAIGSSLRFNPGSEAEGLAPGWMEIGIQPTTPRN